MLAGAIEAVWPGFAVEWGPVPGDLVETEGATLRLSPKLLRVYQDCEGRRARGWRSNRGPAARPRGPGARRTRGPRGGGDLAGGAPRGAAGGGTGRLQRRRDRVGQAAAALAPLGRLLDAVEAGAALPGVTPSRQVDRR